MTTVFLKGSTDARWKDDEGYQTYAAFVAKYLSPAELGDLYAVAAFSEAATLVQVLKQCGDDLSRENIMREAAKLKDLELPMLLPWHEGQHLAREFSIRSDKCNSAVSTARAGSNSATL